MTRCSEVCFRVVTEERSRMEQSETPSEGNSVTIESDHEQLESRVSRMDVVLPEGLHENSPEEYKKTFILGGRTMTSSKWGNDSNEPCSMDDLKGPEGPLTFSIATPSPDGQESVDS